MAGLTFRNFVGGAYVDARDEASLDLRHVMSFIGG